MRVSFLPAAGIALWTAAAFASGSLFEISPETEKELSFSISVRREPDGSTRIECPATSHRRRADLYRVDLVVRNKGCNDNMTVSPIRVPLQIEPSPDNRRAVRFVLSDDFVQGTGLLFRYGCPEKEEIYSADLRDYVVPK